MHEWYEWSQAKRLGQCCKNCIGQNKFAQGMLGGVACVLAIRAAESPRFFRLGSARLDGGPHVVRVVRAGTDCVALAIARELRCAAATAFPRPSRTSSATSPHNTIHQCVTQEVRQPLRACIRTAETAPAPMGDGAAGLARVRALRRITSAQRRQ